MTKKLRRKMKRISVATFAGVLSIATLGVLGAKFFVMPNNDVEDKELFSQTEVITGADIRSSSAVPETKANFDTDGAVLCESLVQGVRDSVLPNGSYTFRVVRKGRNNYWNKELCSWTYKLLWWRKILIRCRTNIKNNKLRRYIKNI